MKNIVKRLNSISLKELQDEVGGGGIISILQLAYWLSRQERESNWQENISRGFELQQFDIENAIVAPPRLAASLICKSETELFGLSMPRFGIQLELGSGGFLHIRRLATLAGQLRPNAFTADEVIKEVLAAPCIADSFLRPPTWLQGFHVISAPLARGCGAAREENLTPFVRHIKPGGGMCGQATCFMASTLHARLSPPIHGMPEVTLIATEKGQALPSRIEFDGLWTHEVAAYFNSPRNKSLSAAWQASKIPFGYSHPELLFDEKIQVVNDFKQALHSYVLSNMPVILPVDVKRMHGLGNGNDIKYVQTKLNNETNTLVLMDPLNTTGEKFSIYKRNNVRPLSNAVEADKNLGHVVVVVGCSRQSKEKSTTTAPASETDLFVFNDPAYYPFMLATAHELLLAACHEDDSGKSQPNYNTLSLGWLLSVTPKAVEMPLLDGSTGTQAGLWTILAIIRNIGFTIGDNIQIENRLRLLKDRPEYRLIPVRKSAILAELVSIYRDSIAEIEAEFVAWINQFPEENSPRWGWLEVDNQGVYVWNAQISVSKAKINTLEDRFVNAKPNSPEAAEIHRECQELGQELLLAAYQRRKKAGYRGLPVSTKESNGNMVSEQLECSLQPALLTSFEVIDERPQVRIGRSEDPIDVYMFMQRQADRIFLPGLERLKRRIWRASYDRQRKDRTNQEIVPIERKSALDFMAESLDNEELVIKAASELLRHRRRVVSVATYLPSLCGGRVTIDPAKDNPAMRALGFVLKAVRVARERNKKRAPSLISVIGGSRIVDGVKYDNETKRFFADCVDEDLAIQNIIDCLSDLLPEIVAADVKLAFEYEPFCLCALGSLTSIKKFCGTLRHLSASDKRWNRIGLNLNIANWAFVGGHNPPNLPSELHDQVFHARVGTRLNGHFAHGPLESGSLQMQQCLAWLFLVEELRRANGNVGFVSFEMECASTMELVKNSFETLKSCFRRKK